MTERSYFDRVSLKTVRQGLISRANGKITPRATVTTLTTRDRCQYPQWPHGATWDHPRYGTYCGKKRYGELAYCAEHTTRCYRPAGTVEP